MGDNVLDVLIAHYLRRERGRPSLRGLLHETPATPLKKGARPVQSLPTQLGVSAIPLIGMMGNTPTDKASLSAVAWAQNITEILGNIDPEDQTDMINRYGHFKSTFVDPKRMIPGMFYTFNYRASTIDAYDKCPLVLVLDRDKDSMLGMNFHYLPPKLRFALFESLMPLIAPLPVFQLSHIMLTYKQLTQRRLIGRHETLKRYNYVNMRGRAVFISPIEWAVALAYPSQQFIGVSATKVWADSRQNLY